MPITTWAVTDAGLSLKYIAASQLHATVYSSMAHFLELKGECQVIKYRNRLAIRSQACHELSEIPPCAITFGLLKTHTPMWVFAICFVVP